MGQGGHLSYDATGYYQIAQNLIQGHGFLEWGTSLRRGPLYPLLMAFTIKFQIFPFGLQMIQALAGAATCGIVFWLGREAFNVTVGVLAAAIQSFDYFSVRQVLSLMPETLLVFLFLLSIGFVIKGVKKNESRDMAWGGFFAGLAVLTKEIFTPFLALVPFWILILNESWKSKLRLAIIFFICFILTLIPWIIRNRLNQGKWILFTASMGHSFYLGNNPTVQGRIVGEEWDVDKDSRFPVGDPVLTSLYTPEADHYLFKLGLEYVRSHPFTSLKQTAKKIIRFWYPYYQESSLLTKGLSVICYVPIFILGWMGVFRSVKRWRGLFPLYGPILYLNLVCAVTISSIRYRFPVMPFLMLFAAFAVHELWMNYTLRRIRL